MYPHWIEVHELNDIRYPDNHLVSVNVDNITFFCDKTIFVPMPDDNGYYTINVTESYDELKALIMDAGYSIHKADPRLNVSHPLSMDDLKDMIGEPVWNANETCWMLVSEDRGNTVYLLFNAGNGCDFDERMLAYYPLYRMKQGTLIEALKKVRGEE